MNFSTNPILPRPTFYMHFPGGKQYRVRQLHDRQGFLFAPGEVKWSRGPGYDSLQNNMKLAYSKLHTGWTPGYWQPEVLNSKALSVSKFTSLTGKPHSSKGSIPAFSFIVESPISSWKPWSYQRPHDLKHSHSALALHYGVNTFSWRNSP